MPFLSFIQPNGRFRILTQIDIVSNFTSDGRRFSL
uniref:Uncharacterized protein n=1 Tax=Arundo donax TaxID=35708 RepID=A0A0A9B667_ARUDO